MKHDVSIWAAKLLLTVILAGLAIVATAAWMGCTMHLHLFERHEAPAPGGPADELEDDPRWDQLRNDS